MWCEDFSYKLYEKLLETILIRYESISLFPDALHLEDIKKPCVFIRHDIDVSPRIALRMAMIEQKHGIRSTYMVMNRPFSYSLNNPDHIDFLLRISDLGHDLGLHYVPTEIDREYDKEGIMKMKIAGARELLESKIGKPINSVSFHIPSKELINGSLIIGDMVNAYSKELMKNYISDSRGVWREGNPIDRLSVDDSEVTQVLVHPIWYGDNHLIAEERIQEFFDEEVEMNKDKFSQRLDGDLYNMGIKVIRKNLI